MKKIYVYFVCYQYIKNSHIRLGRLQIPLSNPITCLKDILNAEQWATDQYQLRQMLIVNYELLRIEDTATL